MGHPDRVGRGEGRVDGGSHVLHVLEDEMAGVLEVDVALRVPVTHDGHASVLVGHELDR